MFSGIIKSTGHVHTIQESGTTKRITIASSISNNLSIDQSVSHNGVCLTVVDLGEGMHVVEVVAETLSKTSFNAVAEGHVLNLETSISVNTLLDGHIVQGHIDSCLTCTKVEDKNGSWIFTFSLPASFAALVIAHGSVCINGVSLTVANLYEDTFDVAIIPYTYENTTFKHLQKGTEVNVEFDVIGKYLNRLAIINKLV
jgi:riboflavin synthase